MTSKTQDTTPSDSRYIPLTQQRYCCVPTCIQMIMLKHNLPLVAAERIGYEMGLIVPAEDEQLFWHPRTGPRPPAGYGTQIGKPEYRPNNVFKKLHIPLHMSHSLIDKFPNVSDLQKYLTHTEQDDKDVLICYDWGTLFAQDSHNGHVCVFDRIIGDTVRFIDPEYRVPKWRIVAVEKLHQAMVYHGKDKSAGCWELS